MLVTSRWNLSLTFMVVEIVVERVDLVYVEIVTEKEIIKETFWVII
jgi:hypothetical protein